MRIVDTTQITDPNVEQPFGGPSLDFLTQNQLETLNSIVQNIIGPSYSSSTVYVLYGCTRTGAADGASSGTTSITAGAVFFNGEIFQVAAFSGTMGTGKAVYSALNSAATATDPYDNTRALDPVTFSDGSNKNVHLTRTWLPAIATSGSNAQSAWAYLPLKIVYTTISVFQNSWAANAGLFTWLDRNNNLHIFGDADGTSASGGLVFNLTLPTGFTPKGNMYGTCIDFTSNNVLQYEIASSLGVWGLSITAGTYSGKKVNFGHIIIPSA